MINFLVCNSCQSTTGAGPSGSWAKAGPVNGLTGNGFSNGLPNHRINVRNIGIRNFLGKIILPSFFPFYMVLKNLQTAKKGGYPKSMPPNYCLTTTGPLLLYQRAEIFEPVKAVIYS
jgi:hypothetical protein